MKVLITADHPIFKRIDKIVDNDDANEVMADLMKFNYENIECNPYLPPVLTIMNLVRIHHDNWLKSHRSGAQDDVNTK